MRITFCGAARGVTGSCNLIEHNGRKYLVDCGLFQGEHYLEDRNYNPFLFDPAEIAAVLITHAHLDHTGRIPKLIKEGFRGQIYANLATRDLTRLVLLDAVEVMTYNAKKYGDPPLFHKEDVREANKIIQGVDYNKKTKLAEDLYFTFHDAGHILGSSFIRLEVSRPHPRSLPLGEGTDNSPSPSRGEGRGEGFTVIFSGDVGNAHVPIVRETAPLGAVDYLILESTYGGRVHEDASQRIYLLQEAILSAVKRGAVVMIPMFSLERMQEVLYELNNLIGSGLLPAVPIFLDSPLAAAATEVYKKYPRYFDEAAQYLIGQGDDFFKFPGLRITATSEESKKINDLPAPKIILAGSGMMNGGRIQHHLLRYLSDKKNLLLIISYQASGTLGRRLLEGAKEVKIYGQKIKVRAQVKAIGSYSAHADQEKLVSWVAGAKRRPRKIFLNHGEPESMSSLASHFKTELGLEAVAPRLNETVDLGD